jgi:hypothetical protein
LKIINSEIIFRNLFDKKQSFFGDLGSTRAIDWKKILLNFHYKGGPLPKKSQNFFLIQL